MPSLDYRPRGAQVVFPKDEVGGALSRFTRHFPRDVFLGRDFEVRLQLDLLVGGVTIAAESATLDL